jgi:hypothetical protein
MSFEYMGLYRKVVIVNELAGWRLVLDLPMLRRRWALSSLCVVETSQASFNMEDISSASETARFSLALPTAVCNTVQADSCANRRDLQTVAIYSGTSTTRIVQGVSSWQKPGVAHVHEDI